MKIGFDEALLPMIRRRAETGWPQQNVEVVHLSGPGSWRRCSGGSPRVFYSTDQPGRSNCLACHLDRYLAMGGRLPTG